MAEFPDDDAFDLPYTPIFFGRFLVLKGYVSDRELEAAIAVQDELNHSFLGAILEQGLISHKDFMRCREYQRSHAVTFEEAVKALELLSPEGIERVKEDMQQYDFRIGDILVRRGALGPEQLEQALKAYESEHSIDALVAL